MLQQFIALKGTNLHAPVAALVTASSAAGTKTKARYQGPQLLGQHRHDIIGLSNQLQEAPKLQPLFMSNDSRADTPAG
jgi:hypothetical protein